MNQYHKYQISDEEWTYRYLYFDGGGEGRSTCVRAACPKNSLKCLAHECKQNPDGMAVHKYQTDAELFEVDDICKKCKTIAVKDFDGVVGNTRTVVDCNK